MEKVLGKFKDIFDLSEKYNNYRLHFIKVNPSCDKNYDDAIKSYKLLYNTLRNECKIEKTNYREEYCKVFNKYFPYEKHSEITSWKCKLKESEEQVQQLVEEPTDDARKDQMPERPEKIVEQRNHLPGLSETGQFVENLKNTNYHEEYCEVFREHFPNEKHSEISSWKCKLQEHDDAIKSYKLLYNTLRNECKIEKTNYREEYCKVFNKYFPYEKHLQISSWNCKLKESEEQVQQLVEEPTDDARKDQMPERPEKIVEQT
ncbi:hypothetical protein PVT01_000022200 [Plasmodium vivax]|uniref:VIR protein n=1 Tax=Plasmodium vivax TaxID=5855 RepID=A0A1G4E639_PLAVI|nr:hypothetical protein PVT01_000022200 [Plasmodium vivax]